VGLREISTRSLRLPDGGEERTIVVYEKRGDCVMALPRRNGLAQHSPLG
jgi:hypothetical protein